MKTVSREELYEQVSSKPMTKVAADYGVRGALAKLSHRSFNLYTDDALRRFGRGKPFGRDALP